MATELLDMSPSNLEPVSHVWLQVEALVRLQRPDVALECLKAAQQRYPPFVKTDDYRRWGRCCVGSSVE
jgi:hypothetical protein